MAFFPFNGIKDSLYGDLHATGKDGVRFFTEKRSRSHAGSPNPGPGSYPKETGG